MSLNLRNRSLLTIQHFIRTHVVSHPVHDIEWEAVSDWVESPEVCKSAPGR